MDFLKQPDVTIHPGAALRFRPVNMDVLPLYHIVLMLSLLCRLILLLMRWEGRNITLGAVRRCSTAVTWQYESVLFSAYPNGFWAFNSAGPGNCCFVFGRGARSGAQNACRAFCLRADHAVDLHRRIWPRSSA